MNRRTLTALFAATALGLSTGCASTGLQSSFAKVTSPFRRGAAAESDASSADTASPRYSTPRKSFFAKDESKSLSPEFREAQKSLKKNPEKTLLAWARYQEDIGEYAEARKMYRELQIAYPDNMESHLGMARIELLTGRSIQAKELLSQLVKEHPKNLEVRMAVGRMYAHQEDWDAAIRAFEEACELEPENQDCRYEMGVAFARAGQFDQALSHLTYSVGAPAANYNIGYILHEQGQNGDAAEWFRNALEMRPDHQTAEKSRAMLAKLDPSALPKSAAGNSGIAQNRSAGARRMSPAQEPASAQPQQSAMMTSSRPEATPPDFASRFTPAAATSSQQTGVALPVVSSSEGATIIGRRSASPTSKSASPDFAATQLPPVSSSPFRTVSHAAPNTAGYSSPQAPPQWHGPTSQPVTPAATDWSSPKDPPSWRARQGQ
jgi:tetratricopeptide (TPR) repeat protein